MRTDSLLYRYKLHHLLFWLVFAAIWFYLRYQDYASVNTAVTVTVIKVLDLALLIYLCNYLLVPGLLYKKRYALFVACYFGLIILSSYYKMRLIGQVTNNPALLDLTIDLKRRIYDNFIPHFFLVTAGVAGKLLSDYIRLQKRLAVVAKERAEAELNFLKSQINPHFLFNSLNAVYFLIDKENIQARNALHKFSDMLRYQLYECNGEKIPIEKEVSYLKDYVDLQKLRLNQNSTVDFKCSPEVRDFQIEPLLLIPFVENSFKHLSRYNDGKQDKVAIDIARSNGSMKFSVYNTTQGKGQELREFGGIGLTNVRKRLELLYPGRHDLSITEREGWFGIDLTLSFNS